MTNAPSGAMAAVYARNDSLFSIWHSPGGSGLPLLADGMWPASSNTTERDLLTPRIGCVVLRAIRTQVLRRRDAMNPS